MNTQRKTAWFLEAHGNVEIYIFLPREGKDTKQETITTIHGTSAAELETKAQQYLDRLGSILTKEEMSRVGYSIRFGMTPICRYVEEV